MWSSIHDLAPPRNRAAFSNELIHCSAEYSLGASNK
jgi:hypothetical protein